MNAILGRIEDALADGEWVEIRGFGAFSIKGMRARQGRYPRTGESDGGTSNGIHPPSGFRMPEKLALSADQFAGSGSIAMGVILMHQPRCAVSPDTFISQ